MRTSGTIKPGVYYDLPSTAYTIGFFFIDISIYVILAWYFDHVDSSNRGKSYSKLFFLKKSYWCKSKQTQKHVERLNSLTINNTENYDRKPLIPEDMESFDSDKGEVSIRNEREKVLNKDKSNESYEGLRIVGVSKIYNVSNNCCGSRKVNALKEVIVLINAIRHSSKFPMVNCLQF